jgi:outer membrane protein assembly factor BamD (BamD/ComL family)
MSVAGISASNLYEAGLQTNSQQQQQAVFQELEEALESGNLTQAQQDYAALTQNSSSAQTTSSSSVAQAFSALGQALQSGNLTGAQQAFTSVQQDVQSVSGSVHAHGHSGHFSRGQNNSASQDLSALGQDLQSGNLSAAQQAFTALEQEFQVYGSNGDASSASTITPASVNVTA